MLLDYFVAALILSYF